MMMIRLALQGANYNSITCHKLSSKSNLYNGDDDYNNDGHRNDDNNNDDNDDNDNDDDDDDDDDDDATLVQQQPHPHGPLAQAL